MKAWKRSIPHVTAASLILGGSSCGGSRGAGAQIADVACRAMRACDSDLFFDYYDSIRDCESYLSAGYQDDIDDYATAFGSACADAYVEYIECYWAQYELTCDYGAAFDACDELGDQADLLCQ